MKKRKFGFTLVELVVVIAVIGILATLTVAYYNDTQMQARNAVTTGVAASWVEAVGIVHAKSGPIRLQNAPHSGALCFGTMEDYPPTAHMAAGECHTVDPIAFVSEELATILSDAADLNGGKFKKEMMHEENHYARGLEYVKSWITPGYVLYYYLEGSNADCSLPHAIHTNPSPHLTECMLDMTEHFGEDPIVW